MTGFGASGIATRADRTKERRASSGPAPVARPSVMDMGIVQPSYRFGEKAAGADRIAALGGDANVAAEVPALAATCESVADRLERGRKTAFPH